MGGEARRNITRLNVGHTNCRAATNEAILANIDDGIIVVDTSFKLPDSMQV
jgi:hypothetical protein